MAEDLRVKEEECVLAEGQEEQLHRQKEQELENERQKAEKKRPIHAHSLSMTLLLLVPHNMPFAVLKSLITLSYGTSIKKAVLTQPKTSTLSMKTLLASPKSMT